MPTFEELVAQYEASKKPVTTAKKTKKEAKKALPKPDFFGGLKDIGERRGTEVVKSIRGLQRGEQGALSTTAQATAQLLGGAVDVPIEALKTGFRALPDVVERPIRSLGSSVMKGALAIPGVSTGITKASEAFEGLKAQDTAKSRNITALLTGAGVAADVFGAKAATVPLKGAMRGAKAGTQALKRGAKEAIEAGAEKTLGGVIKAPTVAEKASRVTREAVETGLNEAVVPTIKRAAPETKKTMGQMLTDAAQKSKDNLAPHPIQRVGKELQSFADTGLDNLSRIGKEVGRLYSQLPNKTVDLTKVYSDYARYLRNKGINIGSGGKLSGGKLPEADLKFIEDYLRKIKPSASLKSVADLDAKMFADLDLAKANKAISAAEAPIMELRNKLKSVLSGQAENYVKKQAEYSELKKLLDPYLKTIGKSRWTDQSIKELKSSRIASQLLNRFSERPKEVIDGIVKAAAKFDKTINPQKAITEIERMANFSDVLENVYKIASPRSFQTQVQRGVEKAAKGAELAGDIAGAASGNPVAAVKAVSGLFGKTKDMQKAQIEAVKKLLGL